MDAAITAKTTKTIFAVPAPLSCPETAYCMSFSMNEKKYPHTSLKTDRKIKSREMAAILFLCSYSDFKLIYSKCSSSSSIS